MKTNTLFTKKLLSLLFVLISLLTFAQTTVYNANFSTTTGNNAWTSASTGSGAGGWTNGTVATHASGATGNYTYSNLYTGSNVYNGNTISSVTSPVVNLTNYTNLILTFNIWYNTEAYWDGANVEYSTDGGGSWSILGNVGDGFYSDTEIYTLGNDVDGWSGNSGGWIAKTINLSATDINFDNNSNVRFRIKFATDGTVNSSGIAFDDFKIVGTPITLFPEIDIRGNGVSIVDGDVTPSLTDFTIFSSVSINTTTTRTFVVRNTGAGPLTLGTYTITGANAGSFTLTTPPPTSIASGGTANIVFTFAPTSPGVHNATFTIYNSDTNENPYNFNIQGSATDSEINIYYSAPANAIADNSYGPDPALGTDFGSTTIGTPVARIFTIQNLGLLPLNLTDVPMVRVIGPNAALFTITQPPISVVPVGETTTFTVTFTPVVVGKSVCIISLLSNDSDETNYDFTIQGVGTVATGREIDVQGNEVSIPDGDTSPSTLDLTDFGTTFVGVPITIPFVVYNFGPTASTLSFTGNTISGTGFAITNMVTSSIIGGYATSFKVTFTPSTTGTFTGAVVLNNNDSNEGPYNFNVRATVVAAPTIAFAPGGVTTNLKLWLKANNEIGTIANYGLVSTWRDKVLGSTRNASAKTSLEPVFLNNAADNVNFNPVIRFNGSSTLYGGQGFNNHDVFIALKTGIVTRNSTSSSVFIGDDVDVNPQNTSNQDITGFSLGSQTSRFTNEVVSYNQGRVDRYGEGELDVAPQPKSYSGANIFNPRKRITGAGGFMDIFQNGVKLTTSSVNTATYKDIRNTKYYIGRSEFYDADLVGDILEIITYDVRNTDADRRKVETYLALKYGITLGVNSSSLNYVNSDGTTIYPEATGYNTNIAGIGRDDKSELNQKQSKTEYTKDDITMGLTTIAAANSANTNTFAGDKRFLIWGHNNAVLTQTPPVVVDLSTGVGAIATKVDFIGINRVWKVVESGGDVGTVKISIPKAVVAATINPPGDFLMFISTSPVFSPSAEYRIMNLVGDNLETNFDFTGVRYITFGYASERRFTRSIDFNGTSDYLDGGDVLNLNSNFTVSAWIKPAVSANMSIFSKRNTPYTQGYDLTINASGKLVMSWMNGSLRSITSNTTIPNNIWHNVAVIYNGTTARLYIDGVLDKTATLPPPISSTHSFLVAAANGSGGTPVTYFNGTIDEIRVWDVALTELQMRYVMNQEIKIFGAATTGNIIPSTITKNDILPIPWTALKAYYPMSRYTFTNAKDESVSNFTLALKNLITVNSQTAPLPYESNADGSWQTAATWKNNTVQDLPHSLSIVDGVTPVDWNIVKTSHNITSTGNKTVLGLMVNINTITASNDTKIEVTNYLKLDGKIDLVGRSQLVQTLDCDLDVTSSGSIERDQQGQANTYNYNYWSSPVSPINTTANNTNYTIKGMMKDGFNSSPREINWITGFNGIASTVGTPMSIARYWLYTFSNANDYANWNKITETTAMRVGLGFTMKGSGISGTQNYTFVGKPNNGLINSNTVLSNQLLLTGNPYPSALDAVAFINDNLASIDQGIDGTLYFWEHYSSNNTHVLKDYKGGYAVRNLVGGVAPVSSGVDFINQSRTSSRGIPNRYIPVGQGFFVIGKVGSGGTITFKNNQRAFFKENDAANSNILYKKRPNTSKIAAVNHWDNNENDTTEKDSFKRVRLGFNSNNNYHRQILLGFMNEKATSGMDYGYDGIGLDEIPNDMYFLNGENQLVIQGKGHFNDEASYPIGIKTDVEGKVSLTIDALENFEPEQKVYIYDAETKTYHEIQKNPFEVNLPAGVNNTRFSLRFKDKSLSTEKTLTVDENNAVSNKIAITHIQDSNTLKINNNSAETTVEKVTLLNINGQVIANWKIENQDQQNIQVPIKTVTRGVYIAKISTTTGELSKKLIIK
jgi:trimeric autotransporter adhesin